MEETLVLILLVIVMLVGSYLAGNIPLVVNWSEEKLKVVTVFGAGLLVGTALTVIIPEGIRALYEDGISHAAPVQQQHLAKFAAAISAPSASLPQQNADPLVSSNLETEDVHNDHSATIGLSLVLGFIFMMLVEQISLRRSGGGPTERNITATLGLVVHAAADGVALGAAATTSHQDVEMIVFLAIMLHKAPAAFGLVSFLLHEGVERQRIRKHLAIFSLSAPLLTLLTYFCIGQEQKETLNSVNATGIAMLFSAGTFLYVATVHVLPELTQNSGAAGHHNKRLPSSSTSSSAANVHYSHLEEQPLTKGYSGLRNTELFIMICGALLPLVITIGHHH